MKYLNGMEVCLGDQVLVDGEKGEVVAVIDSNQYSSDYPSGWSCLGKGALIVADGFGLIHYPEPDEDLIFVHRKDP